MKRVFKGILKTIKTHQDQVRTVRLRNQWVPVDPQYWSTGMDACVNTALGKGTEMEKIATLTEIANKQEMVIEKMGPMNPLCTMSEYRNTLAEIVNLAGFPNEDRFFLPLEHAQVMQQFQEQMQQMQQQLQEAQQQLEIAAFQLKGHTASDDALKHAKALGERIKGFKNIVETAQTANEQTVQPNALLDEMTAAGFMLQ
jgi:hypothetical protein